MNIHPELPTFTVPPRTESFTSPVASERVKALAVRVIEGAPALTAGEMRELARAIIEHNALSEQDA